MDCHVREEDTMSTLKRKLKSLSIDQKLEILDALQSQVKTRKELSVEYGCNLSTIARIVQHEQKIRTIALENGNTARKRLRKGNYEELDQAVAVWFRQMRAENAIINGPMILEVAKQFAQKLELSDFKPSNGWLGRWKAKENVTFHKLQGDKGAANQASAAEWIKNVLPALLADYDPKNVYNADESGLFYKALPSGTLAAKGEKPEGGKTQKDRLTALFLCNMDGSDKQVFVIGRSTQSHCFQGKIIPLPYYANAKAWMTGALWTRILLDFDSEMMKQKRKVLLFADNAACHKLEEGVVLHNVKIQFLPADATSSVIQPLDKGIIRAFKVYYRQKIVRQQLLALEKGLSLQQFAKTVNVLEALKLVEQSWRLVTPTTIQNCFRKAGFSKTDDMEYPKVEEMVQLQIPENEFNDLVDCDTNLECYGELTVRDILEEVCLHRNDDDDEEETQEQELPPPNRKDALAALTVLRAYFEHKNVDLNNVNALEDQLCDIFSIANECTICNEPLVVMFNPKEKNKSWCVKCEQAIDIAPSKFAEIQLFWTIFLAHGPTSEEKITERALAESLLIKGEKLLHNVRNVVLAKLRLDYGSVFLEKDLSAVDSDVQRSAIVSQIFRLLTAACRTMSAYDCFKATKQRWLVKIARLYIEIGDSTNAQKWYEQAIVDCSSIISPNATVVFELEREMNEKCRVRQLL
uniref:HTH CENPB-type domain-containing protein n=1 Tax=Plectus sambesii TaxID=2011161 RepID=A0A914X581_9BILA